MANDTIFGICLLFTVVVSLQVVVIVMTFQIYDRERRMLIVNFVLRINDNCDFRYYYIKTMGP